MLSAKCDCTVIVVAIWKGKAVEAGVGKHDSTTARSSSHMLFLIFDHEMAAWF